MKHLDDLALWASKLMGKTIPARCSILTRSGFCFLTPEPYKATKIEANTLRGMASFRIQLTSMDFHLVFGLGILYFCARTLMHLRLFYLAFQDAFSRKLVQILSSPCCGKQTLKLVSHGNITKVHQPLF